MKRRGWGRILTIGSINQTRPEPTLAVYAALKSAQYNLALNLARQLASTGVTVNNISPGLVATARNRWRRDEECLARDSVLANPTTSRRSARGAGRCGVAAVLGGRELHDRDRSASDWRRTPVDACGKFPDSWLRTARSRESSCCQSELNQ